MNRNPIIIVDDDDDDLELIKEAFAELKIENEIIIFNDGDNFLDYMRSTEKGVFFILCDVNMSKTNGIELKKITFDDERLRLKCVPFIFMSTTRGSASIMKAYSVGVQGYFIKPSNFEAFKELLQNVIVYWRHSEHPNI